MTINKQLTVALNEGLCVKKYYLCLAGLAAFIVYLSVAEIGRTGIVTDGIEKFISLSFFAYIGWGVRNYLDRDE